MWPDKEQQFILSFLRFSLGYEPPDSTMNMLPEILDWEKVVLLADYHGISPLLHHTLNRSEEIRLPPYVVGALSKAYIANSATGLLYEKALEEIIHHFTQKGLSFVVHKGLSLAALLYPEPELRPFGGDFDILIQQEDYPKARTLLEEVGYELVYAHYEQHELDYIGEVKFGKYASGKQLIVDLHTDFNANHWGKVSGFDIKGFWDNLLIVRYGSFNIPCLPVDVYLFFLSIHCAANHIFDRLITFCDIDLLIRKYRSEVDWGHMAEYARINGARKTLYHALRYCKWLLDTPVPNDLLEEIKPGALSIALIPTRSLLLRSNKAPKGLERYMHILLLDNPINFFKSIILYVKRIISEIFIRRKTGSAL